MPSRRAQAQVEPPIIEVATFPTQTTHTWDYILDSSIPVKKPEKVQPVPEVKSENNSEKTSPLSLSSEDKERINNQHIAYLKENVAHKRRRVADVALVFAMLGIVLMIVDTELSDADVIGRSSPYGYTIRGVISLSTIVLMFLICAFHAYDIQIFILENPIIKDWKIAMTVPRVTRILLELIVCGIHPLPEHYYFQWTTVTPDGETMAAENVPIDLFLSIPMFFRAYHIFRVLVLHSKFFTNASCRSVGAMNRVKLDTQFILKTMMTKSPGTVLLIFMVSIWLTASWIYGACEGYHDKYHKNYSNSMWVIVITFLGIGYGDMVPNTKCGRAAAVLTGIMGSGCTALIVAVLAQKLTLTRAEKFVHNFMMKTEQTKLLKDAAANVMRESWLTYKYTNMKHNRQRKAELQRKKLMRALPTRNGHKRHRQRKLIKALHFLRTVKSNQKQLNDDANNLVDTVKIMTNTYELTTEVFDRTLKVEERMDTIEDRFNRMDRSLELINRHMETLPRRMSADGHARRLPPL